MNYTINHSWGCCTEESKGAVLEEGWEGWKWDKLARPTDSLEPAEEREELWGEQGPKQPRLRGVELSHLIDSTHWSNPKADMKCWVPLWWTERSRSCTKTRQNIPESFTRHLSVKAKWTLEIKSSFWSLLNSPWWSLQPQDGLQTYTTSALQHWPEFYRLHVCRSAVQN